jgi:2,4-dienoyl-CoA reductase-like NADH-dependent reductase (Old Yellow Enzyme family)
MCQYSCTDGFASDWHLVHLGARAVGGAALVIVEATAVEPRGRISPQDMGIWDDRHVEMLSRIAAFITSQGAVPAIQIAHSGRKGSTYRPWDGQGKVDPEKGGWQVVGPSPEPFSPHYPVPRALAREEIHQIREAFVAAARRAQRAGFGILEVHSAHGYLLHEFLSPLSNHRTDEYGGSFENRTRFLREVVHAVRNEWPATQPLFVRLSATDWVEGGWDIQSSVRLAGQLKDLGVDLVDCSSGGNAAHAQIPLGPGYQAGFAAEIRREIGIPTGAVGLLTTPEQTDALIREGKADLVLLARAFLRDPHWPLRAAQTLGHEIAWPPQYERAKPFA